MARCVRAARCRAGKLPPQSHPTPPASISPARCASIISIAVGRAGKRSKLDAVSAEGAWPGSRTQLVDTTDLGKYVFEVIDLASNRVLYSRGFASIFGEWETTPEFRTKDRSSTSRFASRGRPLRCASPSRSAIGRTCSNRCGMSRSIRARRRSGRVRALRRRASVGGIRERTAEPEGRPSARQRPVFGAPGVKIPRRC